MLSKKKWSELNPKKNLTNEAAILAVKQNGEALRYVEEQFLTEEN